MEFSRQEYWSGLPFPSPGNLPDPGVEPCIAGRFLTNWATGEACNKRNHCNEKFSGVRLFAHPWTVAHQALLSLGILQARLLEWVAMPFSRGSSQLRDRTHQHWRWILYHLSHQGSPRKLEWVAYPFSRGTSQPRNQTHPHGRQILYHLSHHGSLWKAHPPQL